MQQFNNFTQRTTLPIQELKMEQRTQLNSSSIDVPSSEIVTLQNFQKPQKKHCGLYLANGINIWNFYCILLLTVAINQCYIVQGALTTLLLQDKTYYDVDIKELAQTMANYATIILVIFMVLAFFGRFIYEIWNYRTLIPLTAFVATICVFLTPWGRSVYPGLLSIQFLLSFSLFLEGLNPMMVDYVQNRSKGLANSYNSIVASLPSIIYSFGYVFVLNYTHSLLFPIYITGGLNFFIFIYLAIFVKNAKKPEQRSSQQNEGAPNRRNCCVRILSSVLEAWIYSFKNKVFLLIFLLPLITPIMLHTSSAGLVVYLSKYVYHSDTIEIANHTKYLGISSFISMATIPFIGKLFDRYSARFLYPLIFFLLSGSFYGIYFYESFTSPLAFTLQILTKIFVSYYGALFHASLALHTPKHLKAGIFSAYSLQNRLGAVLYQQVSGPVLDSSYARYLFLICAIIGSCLTLLFLVVAVCSNSIFRVEEEQKEEANGDYKELGENINYK